MSFISLYPSKRPSVKSVTHWDLIFENKIGNSFRWNVFNDEVEVYRAWPYPDFYKVVTVVSEQKKSKLFYGESAHTQVESYVYDLGFRTVLGVI